MMTTDGACFTPVGGGGVLPCSDCYHEMMIFDGDVSPCSYRCHEMITMDGACFIPEWNNHALIVAIRQ